MKSATVLVFCLVVLAACSAKEEGGVQNYASDSSVMESALQRMAPSPAPPADGPVAMQLVRPQAPTATYTTPRLAYSYDYALETRAAAIAGLMARHEAACKAAGPQVCQITGSSLNRDGGRLTGVMSLRAEPGWLTGFREKLANDAKAAGGRITRSSTETEDLTTQIVDTEANLRAKTTLRDRLQALLASRPGKLQELLEVEQQLANVQSEIDAAASRLAVMRQRVDTSQLTLNYESKGVISQQGAWRPVTEAIQGAQGVRAGTIAVIILVLAGLLPLSVVGALIGYGGLRVWRWRKSRRKAPPPAA